MPLMTKQKISIPQPVLKIIKRLEKADYEAYIVGGCVRDLLLKNPPAGGPKDWDITTNARPEEIQKLFPESIYENQFGTVAIKTGSSNPALKIIEVTTFRLEGKYSDKRHPDEIKFAKTIEEDLARRDFTINAMALKLNFQYLISNFKTNSKFYKIIDPFKGQLDLKNKIIRAVGNPEKRFNEDALRLMRAVRLNTELGLSQKWQIEKQTFEAIKQNAHWLKNIAAERIRDEFIKIIQTKDAALGIELMQKTNLLKYVVPELETGIGVTQNKHHRYTVWEHDLKSLDYAAKKNYNLAVRLAALFHDIAKPQTKVGEGEDATFYNHEVLSAKITSQILKRLRFPSDLANKIITLVRYHGFFYDVNINSDASIRRLIIKVGKDNIDDLAKVREADRIGSGCPKALPFKLRHFLFRVEKILKELSGEQPSLKMLKINGYDLMSILNIPSGPKIGYILNILLEEVLDQPNLNNKETLEKRAKELNKLSENQLAEKNKQAKEKYQILISSYLNEIKKKYYVA